jgi:hypothetical protein
VKQLNPDFRDMLCELNAAGAEYLVVGAYAMSAYGYSRSTGDIDIWVRPTPENAERVMTVLRSFGAPLFDLTVADLQTPDMVFQIGRPPNRIDLLTTIAGVEFDRAWTNRRLIKHQGIDFPVLSRLDLIANKKATSRPKDALDAARLEQAGADEDE